MQDGKHGIDAGETVKLQAKRAPTLMPTRTRGSHLDSNSKCYIDS